MAKYDVIVHETNELTYTVEADSAEEAYKTYIAERDGSGHQCGEPDEVALGTEPMMVVSPDGTETEIDDLLEAEAEDQLEEALRVMAERKAHGCR